MPSPALPAELWCDVLRFATAGDDGTFMATVAVCRAWRLLAPQLATPAAVISAANNMNHMALRSLLPHIPTWPGGQRAFQFAVVHTRAWRMWRAWQKDEFYCCFYILKTWGDDRDLSLEPLIHKRHLILLGFNGAKHFRLPETENGHSTSGTGN